MASAQGVRAGRAYVEIGANYSKFQTGLRKAQNKLSEFSDFARSKLEFGAAIAAPIGIAVKKFSDFDDQMRLVQGVTGSTGDAFASLTEKAKRLGKTTSWTAAQVAEGMTSLGRAGFQSGEIDDSIESVMNLARATGTEIGTATDIAGNALRAFGLQASDMTRVCDVLTATANGSAQTLEDLGEAFKYVAPIAASTGASIEDTAKIVGALANFGVKGSQAGTVFKAIQQRMATDSKAKAKYAELGIDTTDAEGNLRKVGDVLTDLGRKIQALPTGEKLETIKTLFGQYGMTGVSLTTANFDALADSIDNCSGIAAETAEKMDAGLGGSIRITQSAIEGLALAIGDSLSPYLSDLAEKIQGATAWLTDLTNAHPALITNVAKFATVLVGVSGGLFAVTKTASLFVSGVQTIASVVSGTAKAVQAGFKGIAKAADFLTGASKASQAAVAANARYQEALLKAESAGLAVTKAKTTAEKAHAMANYAAAQSEVANAQAAKQSAAANAQAAKAKSKALLNAAAVAGAAVAIMAVASAYASWAKEADRAAESARKATDAQERLSQEHSALRDQEKELFEELSKLQGKQSLTNEEFARAQNIVEALNAHYKDLGISCDATSKSINMAADAQERFNAAQKKEELSDLRDETETMEAEVERLKDAMKRRGTFGYAVGHAISNPTDIFGKEAIAKTQEDSDRIAELTRKIEANRRKIKEKQNEASAANEDDREKRVANRTAYWAEQDKGNSADQDQELASQIQRQKADAQARMSAYERQFQNEQISWEQIDAYRSQFANLMEDLEGRWNAGVARGKPVVEQAAAVAEPIVEIPAIEELSETLAIDKEDDRAEEIEEAAAEARRDVKTAGSFDAFEAFDLAQDWQKAESKKQTAELVEQTDALKRLLAIAQTDRDEEYI